MQPEVLARLITDAVEASTAPLLARIQALEKSAPVAREGVMGPRGEKGEHGSLGPVGPPGPAGPSGEPGAPGEPGPQGPEGTQGPPGPAGPSGEPGEDGRDGRDGQPGVPGRQGEKGLDGKDGRDGVNGKDGLDGLGFDDLSVDHDGERTVTLKFSRGDQVKIFPLVFPMQIHRGVYKAGTVYQRGDQVTWAGSSWTAVEDTKAEPGGPSAASRAWVMVVRKGDTGKTGAKGDPGDRGPRGPEGPIGPRGY